MVSVVLVLLFASAAGAESARFSRISVEEGLSQSSVETIGEDRYGFLWFGTQEGLNRFDGHEFTVHQASARPGYLHDAFIRAIVPDLRGDLWIGTESGLQHLDVATGRFSASVTPPGIGVRLNTLRVAPDGRLWFAGLSGGLWTRAPGAIAQPVATDTISTEDAVSAIAFDNAGVLWAATHGNLVAFHVDRRDGSVSLTPKTAARDIGYARVLHFDTDGFLWIGPQGRTPLRFDPRTGALDEYPDLPAHILSIVPAGEGRLWLGGKDAGLTRFDPKTREIVSYRHEPGNEESLAENDVAILHEDRGGSLWIGAWNGGLSRLNLYSQAFRTLRNNPAQPDSLTDNDVTQMAEGPDGRLWTMTRNDVLSAGNPATGSFRTVPIERDLTALAFAGPYLFAGTATGLVEIDPATGRTLSPRDVVTTSGLHAARIEALATAGDSLWILTAGTLHLLSPDDERTSLARVTLPYDGEPSSLFSVSRDRLWIAYASGVLLLVERTTKDSFTATRKGGDSLSTRGRLIAVAEDRGVVWVGTARGFGRLTPSGDGVIWIDPERGMPSRSVASIIPDDAGILWIPTNQGITRFDPASGRAVHFGAVQGAQASGYVDAGATRGRSGLIYFAGRGITIFDPKRVEDNPHKPRVLFTSLEILHRLVRPSWIDEDSPLATGIHAADEVTLGPDDAVFSVEMAAPGASDPDRVIFAHRLDGFDDDWIETTADRRIATYTRLAPGRYLLRARARTQSGVWSANEARLQIEILPPWWRTRLAMAVWLALLVLAIAVGIRETRRRTRVRIALAEQDALRRASMTDPLTGLYNRRFLATWLKHEVPRTLRTHRVLQPDQRPEFLLIVMADLDNLKEINDVSGHDAGDRAIRAIADLLESHARAGDLAVRWGGDEFILVLRSADRAQSAQIVERLREGAETLDLTPADSAPTTISLGFAAFPFIAHDAEAVTWEQTLQLADRALLQSKRRGRNVWAGFVATRSTTAAEVAELLDAPADQLPPASIHIAEGP